MRTRPYNRSTDPRRSERGASLVEILVVMVVLLVGIFTIIRIFPKGFDVLQGSANQTIAHRMADAEVEFWHKNAANLPEGIVAVTPGPPGYSVFDPTARPGDFTSGTGAYGDDTQMRQDVQAKLGSNASEDEIDRWVGQNRQRRILGEITRIPAPAPVEWEGADKYASVYPLAYAPIDWPAVNPTDQDVADQYLQIRGNALDVVDVTNLRGDNLNAALRNLAPRQVGINYRTAVLYFPPLDRPRFFLASYTYSSVNGLKTLRSDKITVPPPPVRGGNAPASTVTLGVAVKGNPSYDGSFRPSTDSIQVGTLDIAPKFRYLTANQPFSNVPADPYSVYEYKVLSSASLGGQFTAAVAFNPRGYNAREAALGSPDAPLQARIDYIVKDWRILHQEVTLPAGNAPYRVRLAMTYIKQAGQTLSDSALTPWPGLGGGAMQGISVVAVDTNDGDVIWDTNAPNNPNGFTVDYRNGLLEFPKNLTVNLPTGGRETEDPAGRTYRVFYSVEGDWSVVPQKAYLQYDLVNNTSLRVPEKILPIGTATIPNVCPDGKGLPCKDGNRLFVPVLFPTADEGKAVNYDYTYRDKNGTLKTVNGEEQQISSELRMTGGKSWYYPLSSPPESFKPYIYIMLPGDANVANVNRDFVLKRVRGVSFRAVTVWKDGNHWRQAAVSTHLTRSS